MTDADVLEAIRSLERKIDTQIDAAEKRHDELSTALVGELVPIRNQLGLLARHMGAARVASPMRLPSIQPAPPPSGPRGPLDTHDALGSVDTSQAGSVLEGVNNLSLWKSKPALVAAFVSAGIGVLVAFGVSISKAQTDAIVVFVLIGAVLAGQFTVNVAAHYRGLRTRKAIVRALTTPQDGQ